MIDVRKCAVIEIIENENMPVLRHEFNETVATFVPAAADDKLYGYIDMERAGVLQAIAAFCGDKVVGFLTVLSPSVPRCSKPVAVADGLFVAKAYRRTGAGMKLIRAAEQHARDIGSPCIMFGTPIEGPLMEIMPKLGYMLSTVSYAKAL